MKNKNNNIAVVVLSVIVLVLFVLFGGYVLVDQGVIKLNSGKEQVEEKSGKEELDINSRLVQNLYTYIDNLIIWVSRENSNGKFSDFYTKNASEQMKMNIVGMNLLELEKEYVNCDNLNIPNSNGIGITPCYARLVHGYEGTQYSYDRLYIETLYKSIFGKDAKLDTSISIPTNYFRTSTYSYVNSEDKYFLYVFEGGGTGGPGGYSTSLKSATKDGKMLYIYEDVKDEIYDSNSVYIKTENYTMTYTFELEDDNMYKFVSAVMKAK